MTLAQYFELALSQRPKNENKEWLAQELGVNYKTLCGWFVRNSFDAQLAISIARVLDLDMVDLRKRMPLTPTEIQHRLYRSYPHEMTEIKTYHSNPLSMEVPCEGQNSVFVSQLTPDTFLELSDSTLFLTETNIQQLLMRQEIVIPIHSTENVYFYLNALGVEDIATLLRKATHLISSPSFYQPYYLNELNFDIVIQTIKKLDFAIHFNEDGSYYLELYHLV